ncbi:twin-arginine translocation signal domain-containing protein [Williamsia sp. CHRR-6]|uniref:twin-arginine translocation signal domain-containing protein n=1 Tax=Williamsia sp. CHRR-6 TaxID=2835871 RepID=UPI001BD9A5EF|nr:twin-arginine translocation signal domain-containing protein [Williamsia sp. CHRR-6]MBT0568406.1 hypothetical protein [Williamsia sp. CHRR-6]
MNLQSSPRTGRVDSHLTPSIMASEVSRRTVMRYAAVAAAVATVPATAACSSGQGIDADTIVARRLSPLAQAASAEAELARTLSTRVPDRAAALLVIANERDAHARALDDEIARLAPRLARPGTASGLAAPASRTSPPTTPGGSSSAQPAAPPTPTVETLRARLSEAKSASTALAIDSDGYRAGLLGSIAASVNAHLEVQLA